jgi:hypothetical protein
MPTKADLEAKVARLREELSTQRYVTQCLLNANRASSEAGRCLNEAQRHMLDALRHTISEPSIPNN